MIQSLIPVLVKFKLTYYIILFINIITIKYLGMKNVATFKNEMSTVDSGEGNFDFSNLVVIVKVKLFLGVGHKSTSRLYSVIFGSSLRAPTQKLAESQLTLMCKLGWG